MRLTVTLLTVLGTCAAQALIDANLPNGVHVGKLNPITGTISLTYLGPVNQTAVDEFNFTALERWASASVPKLGPKRSTLINCNGRPAGGSTSDIQRYFVSQFRGWQASQTVYAVTDSESVV